MIRRSSLKRGAGLARGTKLRPRAKGKAWVKVLDALLRELVLARDRTCQFASAGMGKCGGHLQVCHILPKGKYKSLRHEPQNVLLGCWRHHENSSPDSWHSNPMFYAEWFKQTYPERWEWLQFASRGTRKISHELTKLYLEQELRRYE